MNIHLIYSGFIFVLTLLMGVWLQRVGDSPIVFYFLLLPLFSMIYLYRISEIGKKNFNLVWLTIIASNILALFLVENDISYLIISILLRMAIIFGLVIIISVNNPKSNNVEKFSNKQWNRIFLWALLISIILVVILFIVVAGYIFIS